MKWLKKAFEYDGLREIPGRQHNPKILELWKAAHLPFTDDETPWCAGFVNGVLEQVGIPGTRSGMARSFLKWGRKLDNPIVGCVVVLKRGQAPSGHVGFVTGVGERRIRVLGGNQANAVNETYFNVADVLGYRWPSGEPVPNRKPLRKSKTVAAATVVGSAEAVDLVDQVSTTLSTIEPIKHSADALGLTTLAGSLLMKLGTNPRVWIAVAVLVACAAIVYWRWKDR